MEKLNKLNTAVIVLAGGRSSRMGEDKSLLKIQGKPILKHILETTQAVSEEIVLMLASSQAIPPFVETFSNLKVGRDGVKEQGPLQGIVDALPFLSPKTQFVYIVTCDLPFLQSEWLERLQALMLDGVDVVYSNYDQIDNPLLALYRKDVLFGAPALVKKGIKRPFKLSEGYTKRSLVAEGADVWFCKDVNTPGEYQAALLKPK